MLQALQKHLNVRVTVIPPSMKIHLPLTNIIRNMYNVTYILYTFTKHLSNISNIWSSCTKHPDNKSV